MNPEDKNRQAPEVAEAVVETPDGPPREDVPEPAAAEGESAFDAESDAEGTDDEGTVADDGVSPSIEQSKRTGRRAARPEGSRLKAIVEAMIFVSEQPLSLDRMASAIGDCPRKELKEVVDELSFEYGEREGALEIVEVAGGYQVRTKPELGPWIARLRQKRVVRLSRAALETLAILAYRQPATRAEVEAIRGVDAGGVLGSLLERRLLRILGRKEVPGRPILYGTTHEFLELFGLKNLKELPTLREIDGMLKKPETGSPGPAGRKEEETEAEEAVFGEDGPEEAPEGAPAGEREDAGGVGEGESEMETGTESGMARGSVEFVEEDDDLDGPTGETAISMEELDTILRQTKTRIDRFEEEQGGEEAPGSDSGEEAAQADEGEEKGGADG